MKDPLNTCDISELGIWVFVCRNVSSWVSPLQGLEYCGTRTRAFSPGFYIAGFQPFDSGGDFLRSGPDFGGWIFDWSEFSGKARLKKGLKTGGFGVATGFWVGQ